MKVGIFRPESPEDHYAALTALHEGIPGSFVTGMTYRECDVAVVFGLRKDRVPVSWARGKIFETHRAAGKPVVVVEKGFIHRDEYFHVGWNGLNGRADFRNEAMPPDRWQKLGIRLRPWREDGNHIVVCGQVPWDASVQRTNHVQWCQQVVAELHRITHRPVWFRAHPLVAHHGYGVVNAETSDVTLAEDLENAWACVTFNSNSAVEAAIAGIPVFAFDAGSMASRVANTDIKHIEDPYMPERLPWLGDLAYAQWNLDELRSGEAWRHLTR